TVDGDGNMRRCHFVDEVIGNIDDQDWSQSLRHRLCPNTRCDCHIGYVHLPALGLVERFGEGLLERNPLAKSRR
ncbi:MAG: radical SAM protein, partial [Planctomycetota bacterium]|nr:radical SAM protein [Planctomycetota bacterium]